MNANQVGNMKTKSFSRRDFLKAAGVVVGSSVLVGTGLMVADNDPAPSVTFIDQKYGGHNMSNRILVTYASQAGSTAGVADAIAKSLVGDGAEVDVRPVDSVTDLSPYRAVIVGSAIHGGKWLPEAMSVVERNQGALRRMPTAIFQVCMMMAAGNAQYKSMAPAWLDPIQAQINPIGKASFAGELYPNNYSKITEKLGLRIFLASIKLQAGDYRDWNAIRTWAESLRPQLLKQPSV